MIKGLVERTYTKQKNKSISNVVKENFKNYYDISNDNVGIIKNYDYIKQSILNWFNSYNGEKLFDYKYGNVSSEMLHKTIDKFNNEYFNSMIDKIEFDVYPVKILKGVSKYDIDVESGIVDLEIHFSIPDMLETKDTTEKPSFVKISQYIHKL